MCMESGKETALQKAFEKVLSCSTGRVRLNRIENLMSGCIPQIGIAINKKASIYTAVSQSLSRKQTYPDFFPVEKRAGTLCYERHVHGKSKELIYDKTGKIINVIIGSDAS